MRAIIALGSNLGDPEENLCTAARHLRRLSDAPLRSSSIWRTAPVGFEDDVPEFCNAVVIIETELSAAVLLESLQIIEREMGRDRDAGNQYSSRTIDLDIIDLGGQEFDSLTVNLPHPRAHSRRFVLEPLREVEPEFRFVDRPESLEELIEKAPADPVRQSSPLILSG